MLIERKSLGTKPKAHSGMPLTTRLDAHLGYQCNNNCLFCYFRERKNQRSPLPTEKAKRLLRLIKKLGIETLELTGGEVTLRSDIMELISFAKDDLGFKNISIITNGSRFCDDAFAAEAIRRGVDDVLISVHGHSAELHDRLTDRKGSFDEVSRAITNVFNAGASCRTNTVVNKLNHRYVSDIAQTLHHLGLRKINFIFFSPLDDAAHLQEEIGVRYSDAAPHLERMIDRFRDKFETMSVKAVPFCFLDGYEHHITNFWQNLYDPCEWDFFNRVRVRRSRLIRDVSVFTGLLFFMDIRRMLRIGRRKSYAEAIARFQSFRECRKSSACRLCKYDKVCPGVWKAYARCFGLEEIRAVPGIKIEEIDFSVKDRFDKKLLSLRTE